MVSHTPLQSYRTNFCMQCITGSLGCRWQRYRQSRHDFRKRDIFWFVLFCCTCFYVIFFLYFWLVSLNNFDDFNWFLYSHIHEWFQWYSFIVGLTATVFVYFMILLLLSLCHMIYGHQVYIHPTHLALISVTLVSCIAITIVISDMWPTQWRILSLSLQLNGPFLYVGAVVITTMLSWIVAAQWMKLQKQAARIVFFSVYSTLVICLYAVPMFIYSPCIIDANLLPPKPKVIAHRGASAIAPENTRIAFERAIKYGSYGLETDVQISNDGVLFIMHDHGLDRTTNVKQVFPDRSTIASSFSFTELLRLDAGTWFIRENPMNARLSEVDKLQFPQQRIISFKDFLTLAKGANKRVLFDITVPPKEHPFHHKIKNIVFDTLKSSKIDQRLVWFLINNARDAQIHKQYKFTFVYSRRGDIAALLKNGVRKVNVEADSNSHQWIKKYKAVNITVNDYPVNTQWLFSLYWCMGVDSVTSDTGHILHTMKTPIWTMRPTSFTILWISVNCASAFVIIICFVIYGTRQAGANPESVSLQTITPRIVPNYTETTFQSPSTMKLHLLSSHDSLETDAASAGITNGSPAVNRSSSNENKE